VTAIAHPAPPRSNSLTRRSPPPMSPGRPVRDPCQGRRCARSQSLRNGTQPSANPKKLAPVPPILLRAAYAATIPSNCIVIPRCRRESLLLYFGEIPLGTPIPIQHPRWVCDCPASVGGGVGMKEKRRVGGEDALAHLARLRRELSPEARAAYDERALAIRTVLELAEHRRKKGLSQEQVAKRMEVSQPVIARLEKPFEPSWRQPSLSVLSRYAAALGLTLEVRVRRAA
jgi:DNA-binding XRE family transcriptional regulator